MPLLAFRYSIIQIMPLEKHRSSKTSMVSSALEICVRKGAWSLQLVHASTDDASLHPLYDSIGQVNGWALRKKVRLTMCMYVGSLTIII